MLDDYSIWISEMNDSKVIRDRREELGYSKQKTKKREKVKHKEQIQHMKRVTNMADII